MKETSYYELKMPDSNDTIDVSVLNNNMKRLDDVLILTVIGRNAETSEFVKKCCAPYIMIQNLGEETVTIYDRRWPEDMWEDNKIVIEPSKFYTYRVANSVNANFLVLDNKECNFRYFITAEQAIAEGGGGGGGGTTDYNELDNQPKINGFTLIGNKSFKELGLLNDDGKIKSDYLPPFVDNMDSYDKRADFPAQGEEDKLYLDKSTNLAYVWTGTDYACIGTPLALGITHETAGYGDESRAAYNHSLSEHARVDATKTEGSSQNGYVKINGEETKVYEHPGTGTNPHGTTKTDVGLGNVLDAKQVTVTEQAYSDTEKAQARKNIGAGTSSFSGKYSDLQEIPSEFTPAEHNHDDLYAHKTSVSSSNETTSVINVTDAKAQMAMAASVKGKTIKGNIFDFANNGSTSYVHKGITYTNNKDGSFTVSGTSNAADSYMDVHDLSVPMPTEIKAGKSYYISCKSSSGKVAAKIIPHDGSSYLSGLSGYNTPTLVTIPSTTKNVVIRVGVANSGTTVNETVYPMISEYDNSYVPYGTLLSAPVESVVSRGLSFASLDDFGVCKTIKSGTRYGFEYTNLTAGTYTVKLTTVGASRYYIAKNSNGTVTDAINSVLNDTGTFKYTLTNGEGLTIYTLDSEALSKACMSKLMVYKGNASDFIPPSKTTVLVPSEARNCVGYGHGISDSLCNIADFENGVYSQAVGVIDLGSLTYTYGKWGNGNTFKASLDSSFKLVTSSTVYNAICGKYKCVHADVNWNHEDDKVFSIHNASGSVLHIVDDSMSASDVVDGKVAKFNGVMLVYELATPETKPLTDYIRPLPVENGGTITLVNEHNLDMPSVIKYKKEV